MTGLEIPAVLGALSSLSSILSSAVSIRQLSKSDNISIPDATEVFISKHKKHLPKTVNSDNLSRTVMSMTVISDALLKQLFDEAKECENRYIEARKSAKTISEKQKASNDARQHLCHVLREMKDHNGGVLPEDDEINDFWISYGCQD